MISKAFQSKFPETSSLSPTKASCHARSKGHDPGTTLCQTPQLQIRNCARSLQSGRLLRTSPSNPGSLQVQNPTARWTAARAPRATQTGTTSVWTLCRQQSWARAFCSQSWNQKYRHQEPLTRITYCSLRRCVEQSVEQIKQINPTSFLSKSFVHFNFFPFLFQVQVTDAPGWRMWCHLLVAAVQPNNWPSTVPQEMPAWLTQHNSQVKKWLASCPQHSSLSEPNEISIKAIHEHSRAHKLPATNAARHPLSKLWRDH